MKRFQFERLIKKNSSPFILEIHPPPVYEGGEPIPAEPERLGCEGAVLPVEARKLCQPGGTLTARDRQLYMINPIPADIRNARVIYQGCTYSIQKENNYAGFANVWTYILKGEGDAGGPEVPEPDTGGWDEGSAGRAAPAL